MKVKKANVPVFNVQFSNLEATSALNTCRACEERLQGIARGGNELTSYEKAALAFSKGFQKLLESQGATWQSTEVGEKYPSTSKRGRQKESDPQAASAPASAESEKEPDPSFEDQMKDLIVEDEELLQAG